MGSSHHSLHARMPAVKIFPPMTDLAYRSVYQQFLVDDGVYYVSQHLGAFGFAEALPDICIVGLVLTIAAIFITRLAAAESSRMRKGKGSNVNLFNLVYIESLAPTDAQSASNGISGRCLILDGDYNHGSASEIALLIRAALSVSCDVLAL